MGPQETFTIYEATSYFFCYGFIGWAVEVVFQALTKGKLVNRGFLNGPICPIYGVGLVVILQDLIPLSDNLFLLFIEGALACTVLELITGFAMMKIFHHRWWDYSSEPFNIGGYVCLKFTILWGLACAFVVKLIHPLIAGLVDLVPLKLGTVILWILVVALIGDLAATSVAVFKINRKLRIIEDIGEDIRSISDDITQRIYDGTMKAKETSEKFEERMGIDSTVESLERKRAEFQERREALVAKVTMSQRRLLQAFPNMRSTKHQEAFKEAVGPILATLETKRQARAKGGKQSSDKDEITKED